LLLAALLLISQGYLSAQGLSAQGWFEQGQTLMVDGDWYAAAESFLECLRLNPAHAGGTAALAECYYELGEYDQALSWVRRARTLSRSSTDLANLEAVILIALGRLDEASTIIGQVLVREPYNRDALFAAAELDIARGLTGDALSRYQEVVRRYPDDRRVLLSLALTLGALGENARAQTYIDSALILHPGDYRVYYYAAYLAAQGGRLLEAQNYARQCLNLRPGYVPARSLLASLFYRSGQYEDAAALTDALIAADRNDVQAWYLKGMAYIKLGRHQDALTILATACAINPDDEFVRAALEEELITVTALEDPRRARWASWHFSRARDYRTRNLADQALFEYRRGLRLNPYATDRREYAELLRMQGYPARYLEELKFLQTLGPVDRTVTDAVEAYEASLADSLPRRWDLDPLEAGERHWKLAVFALAGQSAFYHVDSGSVAAALVRDILAQSRDIEALALELSQASFSQAYRLAREAGADYFMLISAQENERDLSLKAELFVGRTASPALTLSVYRSGLDRLRNASRGIIDQLILPQRGALLQRRASQGIIDRGRSGGLATGQVFDVVKKGRATVLNEGIGLFYAPADVVGSFTLTQVDEDFSLGTLARSGYQDRIETGDELILRADPAAASPPAAEPTVNPELRDLLRTLR
jgi:tetratricopeptide (TPR) repeat protein